MDTLTKHLESIQELIKKISAAPGLMPSPKAPIMPGIVQPTGAPASTKNPVKVAQQISDPQIKPIAVKQAKIMVKTDKNGQWKLEDC